MKTENVLKPLINYDIDKILLDDETRDINPYFNIRKLSFCVAGGSGSSKTTTTIKLLLNGIIEFDCLILLAPIESISSGLWKNFIKKFNQIFGDDKIMIIFNLSNNYNGLNEFKKISKKIIQFDGMPIFNDIFDLKLELELKKPVIIFDDFVNVLTKKDWEKYYEFQHNASRLNAVLFSLLQTLEKIPPACRNSFSIVILFVNFLTISNIKTLMKNTVNVILTNDQLEYLINYIRNDENKREALYLIGSDAPFNKKIIYKNQYINFD